MVEADRHLEEEIELERKQAEQMEAARLAKTVDFNKEFRLGLDIQRAEIEAQKLVEKEKFESELALRRSLEAALKEQEIKEVETKKNKMLGMISHKKSLITIFGHKHKIKNFIKKFDISHKKISTASDFVSYLFCIKLQILKQNTGIFGFYFDLA